MTCQNQLYPQQTATPSSRKPQVWSVTAANGREPLFFPAAMTHQNRCAPRQTTVPSERRSACEPAPDTHGCEWWVLVWVLGSVSTSACAWVLESESVWEWEWALSSVLARV